MNPSPKTKLELLRALPPVLIIAVLFYFTSAVFADYFLYHEFAQLLTILFITALVSIIGIYRRKRTRNESTSDASKGYLKSLFIMLLVLGIVIFALANIVSLGTGG